MADILYDVSEKPDWSQMVGVLQQFDEQEQQRIYGMIQGAQLIKRLDKEREENHTA